MSRKHCFTQIEKRLFMSILKKHTDVIENKQTNSSSLRRKNDAWESITSEFNASPHATTLKSTRQLIKLWYNLKARAKNPNANENDQYVIGEGPSVIDPLDTKVMDIDENILTNITVDVDSVDVDGTLLICGDHNNDAWKITPEVSVSGEENKEQKQNDVTYKSSRRNINNLKTNKINSLKCQILEEELEFKKKIHEEELKIRILERQHKEAIFDIELKIKIQELKKFDRKRKYL